MASLRKRGKQYLIQFYWRGKQRTKTLGAISPSKAGSYKAQVETALDAIRSGHHPGASRLLEQDFNILDIEPRLHKVCGHKHLVRLRTALQTHLKGCLEQVA